MSADPTLAVPATDAIYVKTEHGRAALAQRGAELDRTRRSVLILLDGRRSAAAVAGLLGVGGVVPILLELAGRGLIAQAAGAAPGAGPAPLSAPAPAPAPDPARLAHAKTLMSNSAQAYLGLLAADLVRRIDAAADEDSLLRALGHWHMAMQASKRGREVAAANLALIKASLREAAPAWPRLTPAVSVPA